MDPRIQAAREKAFVLYEGEKTPHRSCGIALAETFGLATPPYQSFRKGGITGLGPCGAIQAGLVILGELLGDPDPTGPVTPELRAAAEDYERRWKAAFFSSDPDPDTICNHLTEPLGDFMGSGRKSFCTSLVAEVAAIIAEIAVVYRVEFEVDPVDAS